MYHNTLFANGKCILNCVLLKSGSLRKSTWIKISPGSGGKRMRASSMNANPRMLWQMNRVNWISESSWSVPPRRTVSVVYTLELLSSRFLRHESAQVLQLHMDTKWRVSDVRVHERPWPGGDVRFRTPGTKLSVHLKSAVRPVRQTRALQRRWLFSPGT